MKVLLVNDDGIHGPGLRAMRDEIVKHADVTVVAPLTEQSGVGHAITYRTPLHIHEFRDAGQIYGWQVDGTPADCVKLGVMELCDGRPDLVVSGINPGANVGLNAFYSGTCAGAFEGAMFGVPSVAVSVFLNQGIAPDFERIAADAWSLVGRLTAVHPQPAAWNINFPATNHRATEVRLVPVQTQRAEENIDRRESPRGVPYFWVGVHPIRNHVNTPGFDVGEIASEHISVTPLSLDLTDRRVLAELDSCEWKLEPS